MTEMTPWEPPEEKRRGSSAGSGTAHPSPTRGKSQVVSEQRPGVSGSRAASGAPQAGKEDGQGLSVPWRAQGCSFID